MFYKKMSNLIEYNYNKNNESWIAKWENVIEKNGQGEAYGIECMFKKTTEKFSGTFSYTIAESTRKFENINNGKPYPFMYDIRHDINASIQINGRKNNNFGISFIFNSGRPITLPVGYIKANMFFYGYYAYSGINNKRLPPYHRLDFFYKINKTTKKVNKQYFTLNIYNVYNNLNPDMVYFDGKKLFKNHYLVFFLQ
jgi:hypothetical protein